MNFYNRVPLYPTPAPALTIEPLPNATLPRLKARAAPQGMAMVAAPRTPGAPGAASGKAAVTVAKPGH